jgi:hypothetical protein
MWGNTLGWGISAVLVVIIAAVLYVLVGAVAPTPPTDLSRNPANLAALDPPMPPTELLPAPTEDGDAGDVYREFLGVYQNDPTAANVFQKSNGTAEVPKLASVLLPDRSLKRMTLFSKSPQEVINYDIKPSLDNLEPAAQSVVRIAMVVAKKDPAAAADDLQAVLALGRHLSIERIRYEELRLGLAAMETASDEIALLEKNSPRGQAAAAFSQQIKSFRTDHLDPIWPAIGTVDGDKISVHAGDIIAFSRESHERMWKIEALITMGRFKIIAGVGDRSAAARTIRLLASDPDPLIQAAAIAARDVTPETIRQAR